MIPRPILIFLVYALPLLIVAFGVLMGGYALAHSAGDQVGASVLWWIAMSCLMLTAADAVLLIGTLGVEALSKPDNRQNGPDS